MSATMWIVGSVIFAVYMYFTIWNINNGSKPPQEREDASYDVMDMDGMGNFSRFPTRQRRMEEFGYKKVTKKRKVKSS